MLRSASDHFSLLNWEIVERQIPRLIVVPKSCSPGIHISMAVGSLCLWPYPGQKTSMRCARANH